MSVDKFGRHAGTNRGPVGRAGIGFQLDHNNNFDITNKRLTNISKPINDSDAVTKKYVDEIKSELMSYILEIKINKESIQENVQGSIS